MRFDFDEWGAGSARSDVLNVTPGIHRVEIFVGAQVARQSWPASWHLDPALLKQSESTMKVWLDGNLVWTTPILYHQDTYDFVSLGSNPQGFSTADMIFPTGFEIKPYTAEETRGFIRRNLDVAR